MTETQTGPTGPRTPEGKAISSLNATKHGLASKTLIIEGEDLDHYIEGLDRLRDDLKPSGELEQILVVEIAQAIWFKGRALRFINKACARQNSKPDDDPIAPPDLGVLLRYQNQNERLFNNSLRQLQLLQKNRKEFVSHNPAKVRGNFPDRVFHAPKLPPPISRDPNDSQESSRDRYRREQIELKQHRRSR